MKKWVVFGLLILLIFSVLFPVQTLAQSSSIISLEEKHIVFPGSDVELISLTETEKLYAIVNRYGEYRPYRSENQGRSWERLDGKGLPEREKFISLKTFEPEMAVLATKTRIYLSRDGGQIFESLGGPPGLTERREEITSLAVSGSFPLILVGIWNPAQGKLAEDGVYLWGAGGKAEWQPQGMRLVWQGKSYNADVAAVGFWEGYIFAVATGNPEGPLPEGTYLNIAHLGQRGTFGIGLDWNFLPDWPIEVSQVAGQSPKEAEILNSKMVFSEFAREGEGRIYIIYNTRQRVKDDVYRIRLADDYRLEEVRKLEIPKAPEILSLDSIDYSDKNRTLVAGTTVKSARVIWGDGYRTEYQIGAAVYSLPTNLSAPEWERKWMEVPDSQNCQVVISADGTIFVATSGPASYFGQGEKFLFPVSLIDATPGINQVFPSADFLKDKTLFFNYGNRSIFRVRLAEDYQLLEAQRTFYLPNGFDPARLKIDIFDQNLFLFESRTKSFWLSRNLGLSWSNPRTEVEMMDAEVGEEKIWIAGRDGMAYLYGITGTLQKRISSGMAWLGKIEPGPEGKVIAVGGSREWYFESLSIISEDSYQLLPFLPVTAYSPERFKVVYSPEEKVIYYAANNQLYRLPLDGGDWEKIGGFSWQIADLLFSSQGLYIFTRSEIYFTSFPLSKDSKWEKAEGLKGNWLGCRLVEFEAEKNLLLLWDSTKITVFTHQILEEEPEPVLPPTPLPIPAPTPAPTPSEPPKPEKAESVVKPEPELVKPAIPEPKPDEELLPPEPPGPSEEKGSVALIVAVIVLSSVVVFLLIVILWMWRNRYYF